MCELLLCRTSQVPDDPTMDVWAWKRGMIMAIAPDNFQWGAVGEYDPASGLAPTGYCLLKYPGIDPTRAQKYIGYQIAADGVTPVRRRLWQIQWTELPLAARQKFANTGVIVIGPAGSGADYTWTQVKGYFERLDDGTRETADL